jgi:hypothetical protein
MANKTSDRVIRPKLPVWWRIGRWLLLLLAMVIALHFGWGRIEQRKLAQMVAQYHRDGEPILPEDFDQPAIPDADNAAIDLRAAAGSIDKAQFREFGDLEPQLPLSDKESLVISRAVANYSKALSAVDSAMDKKGIDWELQRRTPVIFATLPDLNQQRDLARLLAGDLLLAHQAGDEKRAILRAREILFISRCLDQQPSLISHLVANGIAMLAVERVIQIAPTLTVAGTGAKPSATAADPAQVKALIEVLLSQDADNAGLARAMRGERMMRLDSVTAMLDGKLGTDQIQGGQAERGSGTEASLSAYALTPMLLADGRLMMRHMTQVIAAAPAANLPAARSRLPVFPAEVNEHRMMHLFASILLPSLNRSFDQQFRFRTDMTLAAASLAVRRYALDHNGEFPAQLDDLAPRYLPVVPLDPMTAGKPLSYIRGDQPGSLHAGDPIIYSVGENGTDEGGSEQPLRKSNSPRDRWGAQDAVVHLTQQPRKPDADADDGPGQTPPTAATTVPSDR